MQKRLKEKLKDTEVFIELNEDRILVLPDQAPEKTKGGIILPEQAKERPQRGTVIAVGPGTDERPVRYSPGDRVIYGKYAGSEISHKKVEYVIMRSIDITGKILIEDPEASIY